MGAVSIGEVLDRFTDQVATLDGFREYPDVFDPAEAPAGFADYPFAVDASASANTQGLRDRPGVVAMELTSQMVVVFYAPLNAHGAARRADVKSALQAEGRVIRKLMQRGDPWMHGLRVFYVNSERAPTEDGGSLRVAVTFDVQHLVELT